ncbi:MAG: hypothetical protein SNJ84_09730 [Verrucomicrobiia bacterium]
MLGILFILGMLTVSWLNSAKSQALSAQTASNLRQLFIATQAYSIDNQGQLPRFYHSEDSYPQTWHQRLAPYVHLGADSERVSPRIVFNSPYQNLTDPNRPDWWNEGTSFGMNNFFMSPDWDYSLARVSQSSSIVLAGDMEQTNCDFVNTSDGGNWYTPGGGHTWALPAFRHQGDSRAMFVFLDGHVRALTREELLYNPTNGPNVWREW